MECSPAAIPQKQELARNSKTGRNAGKDLFERKSNNLLPFGTYFIFNRVFSEWFIPFPVPSKHRPVTAGLFRQPPKKWKSRNSLVPNILPFSILPGSLRSPVLFPIKISPSHFPQVPPPDRGYHQRCRGIGNRGFLFFLQKKRGPVQALRQKTSTERWNGDPAPRDI